MTMTTMPWEIYENSKENRYCLKDSLNTDSFVRREKKGKE